ncbi:MAG TPA: hypothetical protein P5556_04770 [Candidatus Gastranaerophilales bacterium]|nr:hypothetical protein [Candidatus Gastranaerophilales bacterium]
MILTNFSQNPYTSKTANKIGFKNYDCCCDRSIWDRSDYCVPSLFRAIKPDFLYRGGKINSKGELDFLIEEKGIKSILSLVDPNTVFGPSLSKEISLINQAKNHADIVFDYFDYFKNNLKGDQKLIESYAKKINGLPKPIYAHCYAGLDLSDTMTQVFLDANKQGLIKYN